MLKQDENGFEYYESLPPGYRLAELSDFTTPEGRRKLGLEFLLFGIYWPVYQVYHVTGTLTSDILKPFLQAGRCYVKIV